MSKHICDEEFPVCPENAKAGKFYKLRVKDFSPARLNNSAVQILNPATSNHSDVLLLCLHAAGCVTHVSVVAAEEHP